MNPKLKSENYSQLGGINTKVSAYLNTPLEFLDIKNFDFQKTGALTQRWGSTQYVTQNFSGPITALYEFNRLDGASYVLVGTSGALWYGATTGQSQGASFSFFSSTLALSIGHFEVTINSTPPAVSNQYSPISTDFKIAGGVSSVPFFYASPIQNGSNILDFVTFNNHVFAADGNRFFKFNGQTFSPVGLMPPSALTPKADGATLAFASLIFPTNLGGQSVGFGLTGYYALYGSYVNSRGYETNTWLICTISANQAASGFTNNGQSYIGMNLQMLTPLQYDIASINIYSYWRGTTLLTSSSDVWNLMPRAAFMNNFPVSGSTITVCAVGNPIGGQDLLVTNQGRNPDYTNQLELQLGTTFTIAVDAENLLKRVVSVSSQVVAPRYLEIYKNRLFAAGMSTSLSSLYFSDLNEPERFAVDSNIEVRTNDADYITALKAYSTKLFIFKKNSFFALLGDNPNNFSLQEMSIYYGCLNNNCAVVYEQILLFLDRKGVVKFNGADIELLSTKVENYFQRMNYNVAVNTAVMVHDKLRNQILIAIPIDGSTFNNITLVYDYFSNAWTTYDGYAPTVFAEIQGRNNTKNVFYGTSTGLVNWFGPSFLSDNGAGFTTSFKTRFLHDMGESVQKQFRRLYMNMDSGITMVMPVNFYQDYGASVVYSTTFVFSDFQQRIDFGISAKSLAYEIANIQQNSPLRIYGFTIESRLQRKV